MAAKLIEIVRSHGTVLRDGKQASGEHTERCRQERREPHVPNDHVRRRAPVTGHECPVTAIGSARVILSRYSRPSSPATRNLDDLLTAAAIRPVAVDAAQAHLARDGFQRYGKGQASAGLNLGDCFSYALATSMNRPLLFKGDDVGRTDIARAVI